MIQSRACLGRQNARQVASAEWHARIYQGVHAILDKAQFCSMHANTRLFGTKADNFYRPSTRMGHDRKWVKKLITHLAPEPFVFQATVFVFDQPYASARKLSPPPRVVRTLVQFYAISSFYLNSATKQEKSIQQFTSHAPL